MATYIKAVKISPLYFALLSTFISSIPTCSAAAIPEANLWTLPKKKKPRPTPFTSESMKFEAISKFSDLDGQHLSPLQVAASLDQVPYVVVRLPNATTEELKSIQCYLPSLLKEAFRQNDPCAIKILLFGGVPLPTQEETAVQSMLNQSLRVQGQSQYCPSPRNVMKMLNRHPQLKDLAYYNELSSKKRALLLAGYMNSEDDLYLRRFYLQGMIQIVDCYAQGFLTNWPKFSAHKSIV